MHGEHEGHDHGIAIGAEEERARVAWRQFLGAAILTIPAVILAMFGPTEVPPGMEGRPIRSCSTDISTSRPPASS